MNADALRQAGPEHEGLRERLLELRKALLNLHKALLDSERVTFERSVGEIQSPNHFLQLLTSDPWFAWLHPLSRLIVSMDEALDQKEPVTTASVDELMRQSGLLLVPAEHDAGFSGHYFEALQRDPHVVLTHAELVKLLGQRKTPVEKR
jgi:hypothetical protein